MNLENKRLFLCFNLLLSMLLLNFTFIFLTFSNTFGLHWVNLNYLLANVLPTPWKLHSNWQHPERVDKGSNGMIIFGNKLLLYLISFLSSSLLLPPLSFYLIIPPLLPYYSSPSSLLFFPFYLIILPLLPYYSSLFEQFIYSSLLQSFLLNFSIRSRSILNYSPFLYRRNSSLYILY